MIPTALPALLVVVALVPGWFNRRLLSRFRAPSTRTSVLSELIEMVAIGLATTGVSLLLIVVIPHGALPFTLNIDEWEVGGDEYLKGHIRSAAGSFALVLAVALVLAFVLAAAQRGKSRPEFHPKDSVWVLALGKRGERKVPWVGLQLLDGRLVEGELHSYSLDDLGEERDIALTGAIRVTGPEEGAQPRAVKIDRIIMPFRQVEHIIVIEGPERGTTASIGSTTTPPSSP